MFSFFRQFADNFIAQGDYALPFRLVDYLYKNFFLWSFQAGAANLDGVLRIPGRLIVVATFGIFGNLVASYFYLGLSYAIVAVSFWVFLRYFLKIRSLPLLIILTLLVALSPAFLGNTAKVGLVAAAGLLPLCLLFTKQFFRTNKFVYLFGIILCLNYSLIHPYNFTMNFVLTGMYALYLFIRYYRKTFKKYLPNVLLAGGAAILMSMYFILPIAAVGTIDKSVLSQDISTEPTDYSGIINIANAGDPISAFTLSKHVFLDFNYYTATTYILYTIGVLALYAVIIGLFLLKKESYSHHDRFILIGMLFAVTLFIFMSSGHAIASAIFQYLVTIPGGWIFRSPLKWQLYIPFFLITALAIQLKYFRGKRLRYILIALCVSLILQSSYLVTEIYTKLLTPRAVVTFSQLSAIPDGNRILYLTGSDCANYLNKNPSVNTELNQVLNSKQIQVKKTSQLNSGIVKASDYDYVLLCKEDGAKLSETQEKFTLKESFNTGAFRLYKNTINTAQTQTISQLYKTGDAGDLNQKTSFIDSTFSKRPGFLSQESIIDAPTLTQVYSGVSDTSVSGDKIAISRITSKNTSLLYNTKPIYYQQEGNIVNISPTAQNNYQKRDPKQSFELKHHDDATTKYIYHASAPIKNSIKNGSFESGPWTEKVEDCFNYDDQPDISMAISKDGSAEAKNNLALSASRHVACTSQNIDIKNAENLLLSFKYKSNDAKVAGYSLVFNDKNRSTYGARPKVAAGNWQNYSTVLPVPDDASHARLILYGYPKDQVIGTTTQYDAVSAYQIGDDVSGLFNIEKPQNTFHYTEAKIKTETISPAEKRITIPNASGMHAIKNKDTFSQNWQMLYKGKLSDAITPITVDGFDQGWIVDTEKLCAENDCQSNQGDGHLLEFTMRYKGQDMLVLGSIISGSTFLIIVVALLVRKIKNKHA
ncbi:hypothetical protein HY312_01520 [Candidatus Saccharibacteria bacterium]|nr:hypothetical protein [Candidatus Saccharibacteria bacterium]